MLELVCPTSQSPTTTMRNHRPRSDSPLSHPRADRRLHLDSAMLPSTNGTHRVHHYRDAGDYCVEGAETTTTTTTPRSSPLVVVTTWWRWRRVEVDDDDDDCYSARRRRLPVGPALCPLPRAKLVLPLPYPMMSKRCWSWDVVCSSSCSCCCNEVSQHSFCSTLPSFCFIVCFLTVCFLFGIRNF